MTIRSAWPLAYAVFASIAGIFFVAVNAPFQVPDEVGHYWRAAAIAEGSFVPAARGGPPTARVPRGVKELVATTWVETAGRHEARVGRERLERARSIELHGDDPVAVKFPAFYTPLPYLPQAAVLWTGARLDARPLVTFYAARLANLLTMVALLCAAMVIAPQAAWLFAAAGSLPMTLHLAGSLSPDPFTLGVASVALAIAITGLRMSEARFLVLTALAALVLALCKPVYFLIPLVAIWNRNVARQRRLATAATIVLAMGVGALASGVAASRASYDMRGTGEVDSSRQFAAVAAAPLRFAGVALADYRDNHRRYRHELVGRLGWLDVPLPSPLSTFAQLLFFAAALSAGRVVSPPQRLMALLVLAGGMLLIALSQYLVWTPVGAASIEGIQGRYFIPLVALPALAVQTRSWPRVHAAALALLFGTLVILDGVGIYRVATRYF